MSTTSDRDEAVDALYALAPGDFVAARNALSKQMKADGRRDEAAAVAKLKKPSVVAWALNQAVRAERDPVARLIDAAERQAVAQQDLLEGGDADALRAATADRRDAARAVIKAAVSVAGPTHADAVRTTLDAAVADPDLVERLRSGTLVDTLDAPAGFGFGFGVDVDDQAEAPAPRRARASRAPARRRARATEADDEDDGDEDDGDEDGAQERAEAQEAARREAQSMVARLERELTRAEKWVGRAERSVAAAAEEADAAAEALAAAQERVDEAEAERRRAEQELADRDAERARQVELLEHARALVDDLDGEG